MNLFPEPHETIEGVGRVVRDERRTFVDVLESCFARIEEWEPKVNAWAFVDREGAMAQARERDGQLLAGDDRGPLHGIPFGIKDIVDVAGMPTSAGARLWSTGPAEKDAAIVARLREAGAVILGKTVTTPYAWVDPPPTRNPWDLDRTPGGSSSGSAVAVACGMCLGAVGTQTGGSLTRPAAFCGVASLKPASNLSIDPGIVPLAPSLDTSGFLARTVGDLYLILRGLHGRNYPNTVSFRPRSPHLERLISEVLLAWGLRPKHLIASFSEPATVPDPPRFAPARPPILGRVRGFFQDLIEPSARVVFETALMDLAGAGAEVVEVEMPEAFGDVHRPHRVVMAAEAASVHSARMARQPDDYPPKIRALVEEGFSIPAQDYIQALEIRRTLREAVDRAMAGVHALVVPAALGPAPDRSTTGDPAFNSPWTFTRSPTISFPIGLSGEGLPLAVQVVGHSYDSPFEVALWCEEVIRRERSGTDRKGPP